MPYHYNASTGEVGQCKAVKQGCPFGTIEDHHSTAAEARTAYEKSMIGVTIAEPLKKTQSLSTLLTNIQLTTVKEMVEYFQGKYPAIELLRLQEDGDDFLVLAGVRFKEEARKQGLGTNFMEDLCKIADHQGRTLALTPSTDWGATSLTRLTNFYKRFDFKANKGRFRDFRTMESMIRAPQPPKNNK